MPKMEASDRLRHFGVRPPRPPRFTANWGCTVNPYPWRQISRFGGSVPAERPVHEAGGAISSDRRDHALRGHLPDALVADVGDIEIPAAVDRKPHRARELGVGPGATVVCVLTGHGLKDPDIAISQISVPTVVDADLDAVLDELSL